MCGELICSSCRRLSGSQKGRILAVERPNQPELERNIYIDLCIYRFAVTPFSPESRSRCGTRTTQFRFCNCYNLEESEGFLRDYPNKRYILDPYEGVIAR